MGEADALMDDVQRLLDDVQELSCAVPLQQFVTALSAFEPPLMPEPMGLGLRFRTPGGVVFCEISVFSELFLVRVGGDTMEFRVRTVDAARAALDALVTAHVLARGAESGAAATLVPVRPGVPGGNVQPEATDGNPGGLQSSLWSSE